MPRRRYDDDIRPHGKPGTSLGLVIGIVFRNGKVEVWVERTVGTKTERVSNVAYLLF